MENRHYQRFVEIFREHELTPVCVEPDKGVEVYRLARPQSSSYYAMLIFIPTGICIMGDVRFGSKDAAICHGYGRKWFGRSLDADYLGGKFGFSSTGLGGRIREEQESAIAMLAVIHETFCRLNASDAAQP